MSITVETAKAHANDPAVSCCRFEAGITIEPSNLEDPAIFPDLEDSGLLTIPEDGLKISQVLGAKLVKTIDALTPITPEYIDAVQGEEVVETQEVVAEETVAVAPVAPVAPIAPVASVGQTVKIHIGEGRDINLEIPLGVAAQMGVAPTAVAQALEVAPVEATPVAPVLEEKDVLVRSLKKRHFKIEKVEFADETKIEGTTLYLRKSEELCAEAEGSEELVKDFQLEIITPEGYSKYSETIMDVQPIATKEEGELGEGVTRVIDGVVMVLTGTDENGVQIGEFGSSEGNIDTNMMWGRPGAAEKGEIFIKGQATI
ncbi:MAG: glycine/sarcosine/betaine reductase component B subunit, partial [Clostridioides sp.]|nr:glycine/sarcosine/betaine reductase component B subunit [Clostridioides sp.]